MRCFIAYANWPTNSERTGSTNPFSQSLSEPFFSPARATLSSSVFFWFHTEQGKQSDKQPNRPTDQIDRPTNRRTDRPTERQMEYEQQSCLYFIFIFIFLAKTLFVLNAPEWVLRLVCCCCYSRCCCLCFSVCFLYCFNIFLISPFAGSFCQICLLSVWQAIFRNWYPLNQMPRAQLCAKISTPNSI